VSVAMKDAEEFLPRPHGFAVLVGEDARDLVKVGHVVDGPGGEKLRNGDETERGMGAAALEIFCSEVQGLKLVKIAGAKCGEVVEELGEAFALGGAGLAEAIEGGKGLGFAVLEDDASAGRPIAGIAVGEMADDIIDRPSGVAFVAVCP